MKELKIMPEYQCYLTWLYDENGTLIDNLIPDELKQNANIINLIEEIQNEFDHLYANTKKEFVYIGFENDEKRKLFINKIEKVCNLISQELKGEYKVTNALQQNTL